MNCKVFGQRLDQEYDANVILTAPNVEYRAELVDNDTVRRKRHGGRAEIIISNAHEFPELTTDVRRFLEPMVALTIVAPNEYLEAVNALCGQIRGEPGECASLDESRVIIKWRLPMADVIIGFFEDLKRITRFL